MRLMFNWKRRLARLQGGFGRDSIGGNTNYVFTILHLSRGALQRNQGTKGDLSGCVRPRELPSCGATTDVGGPGQLRGLSFGEIGIPFRASGRGFPARAELYLGLLQGGRADPAKITIRVMAITSQETRLP